MQVQVSFTLEVDEEVSLGTINWALDAAEYSVTKLLDNDPDFDLIKLDKFNVALLLET